MAAVTYTSNFGVNLLGAELGAWMVDSDTSLLSNVVIYGIQDFTSGSLDGWAGSNATLTAGGGDLKITLTANNGFAYKDITTVVGQGYKFRVMLRDDINNTDMKIRVEGKVSSTVTTSGQYAEVYFTATSTTTRLEITSASALNSDVIDAADNIKVETTVADITSNTNGLDIDDGGSISRTIVSSGAEMVAYSGFSYTAFLKQVYNPDLDFYSGTANTDFFFAGWAKIASTSALETIFQRDSAPTTAQYIRLIVYNSKLVFELYDGTTVRSVTSNTVVDNNNWYFITAIHSAGSVYLYVNSSLDNSTTGSALSTLNNSTAVFRVGLDVNDLNPLINGSLAAWRFGAFAPTPAQLRQVYDSEKKLFEVDSKLRVNGNQYSLDVRYSKMDKSVTPVRNISTSLSGVRETILHRQDTKWSIGTIPMLRSTLPDIRLFLESAADGQVFTFDPYGTVAVPDKPLSVYLNSNGYSEAREAVTEYFRINFEMIEA